MSWTTFLECAPAGDHAVQIYLELDELASSVGRFLGAGFRRGDPGLIIAKPSHLRALCAELERGGWRFDELEEQGLLTCCDADETLAAFMDGGDPSADRFEDVVGDLVDTIADRFPDKTVRAFGEMVDVLVQRGQLSAAVVLEQLWNQLFETRQFALLCGYELDVFDLDTQTTTLPEIVRTHTHQQPIADAAQLAAAVDKALMQVVGADAAARIYMRVTEDVPRTELPRAQAVLMWLSRHEPATAQGVLQGARARYAPAA